MKATRRSTRSLIGAFLFTGLGLAGAEDLAHDDAKALAQKSQNPISDLISLPLQNNFLFSEDGGDVTWNLNVQPVIPISLNEDWNLITRTIVPLFAMENAPRGFDSIGMGDINFTGFFSPKDNSGFIWGLGPVLSLPTATDDIYGSGKWGAGPSFVGLWINGPWVAGGLVNNIWSVAGDDNRDNVNALLVQPFVNYNFSDGWYATFAPILTADWTAASSERWTVPLGGGFGKVFSIGKQPINTSLQAYYNVERPEGGTEWSARFQVQLLFPK
jgi:hypothetical protein